ncbi:hypothetical protein F5Y07DRAFT_172697 [Xylaria sp. FL0933]|nr:hypothetical protein F5Y07DRAFT_172697 [Xylaria sp. FL0933]
MDDSTSPRSERKRPHEHHDTERRRVRRRSDEYHHGSYVHGRRSRSRSERRSERPDRRDSYTRETARAGDSSHTHQKHGDVRGDRRHKTGHGDDNARHHHTNSRSRSPACRHRHSHRHRSHHSPKASSSGHNPAPPELPCGARPLSRSADFDAFRPLFARYLDVQKQIDIATLDEREARGRWKSFVSKWNNGGLAEGWYRPETFEDAMLDARGVGDKPEDERRHEPRRDSSTRVAEVDLRRQGTEGRDETQDDDDDDDYGPTLPTQDHGAATSKSSLSSQTKHGAGIPSLSDLTLRRELDASDRDDARALLRHERKADRAAQKERLEELAPRADAGTAARRLEKRREVRDSNAAFANAKAANEMAELGEAELLGGEGGGLEEYKRLKREAERKKTEREIRREEIWRAKKEEREERAREYREREASTVDMLREIAKSRFG